MVALKKSGLVINEAGKAGLKWVGSSVKIYVPWGRSFLA